MSRRIACLLLLLAAFIAVAASKNPAIQKTTPKGTRSVQGPSSTSTGSHRTRNAIAIGAMTQLARLIHPFSQIFLMVLDSWMRHYKHKALPCKITSFVPLRGNCTPVQ